MTAAAHPRAAEFRKLKDGLEELAAGWRTDAYTVRLLPGSRIQFDPEDADALANLLCKAADAIGALLDGGADHA